MGMPLVLVKNTVSVSQDTVSTIERMLEEAKRGELQGVAAVCQYRSGYSVEISGSSKASPTWTLGAIHILRRQLERLIEAD